MIEDKLITIGLLFLFAIVGGLISSKFKQPVVLGLLIVGTIIGPNALNIVNDKEMIDLMIEFGAILFLFVIGLEFSLSKLMKTGSKSLLATMFKVGIMFFTGFTTVVLLGFDVVTAAFTGVAISFSSTMIVINILKQKGLIKRSELPLMIAILVLEDVFGVVALTFFASMKESGAAGLLEGMEHLILSLTILIIVYVVMSKFAEHIVTWLRKNAGDDLIVFMGLGLCAGFAYLAFLLELSPSAGAFLAGSVVSTFRESKEFEHAVQPHSFMFTSFFFIAMGTMINVASIKDQWFIILVLLVATIVGLFFAMGLVTRVLANFKGESSLFTVVAMLPPGSFSLLVARESTKFNVGFDLVTMISVSIILMAIVMAFTVKHSNSIYDTFSSKKNTKLKTAINAFSNYIASFFDEIELESTYSNKLKRKISKLTKVVLALIFSAIALSKLLRWLNLEGLYLYIAYVVSAVIIAVIIYYIYAAAQEVNSLIIKILSNLEGGVNAKRTRAIVKYMLRGFNFILLGLFSPLLLYILNTKPIYILIPAGLIGLGLFMLLRSWKLLKNVSLDYKYTVHNYKKAEFNSSSLR